MPAVVGTAMNGTDRSVERPPAADDFEVIERVARICQQRRDGLAEVNRAAAAARHDDIGTVLPGGFDCGPSRRDRGLAIHGPSQQRKATGVK